MRLTRIVLTVCTVGLMTLTACADDRAERDDAAGDRTSSSAPTDSASGASTPPEETESVDAVPEAPGRSGLLRGLDPARTPDEKAVTDTWFRYWTQLTRMYTRVEVDRDAFARLARGDAFSGPVGYVERMRASGTSNRGGSIASVEKVAVTGDTAVVTGCQRSDLVEQDADGNAVEAPTLFVRTRESLQRQGDRWIVVEHDVLSTMTECDYR